MNAVIKASVVLAVAVTVVSYLVYFTGLHTNPVVGGLGSIVIFILLNIAAVIWALRQTAAENGYGKQLLNGLLVGVIGGVLIFVLSWATLSFILPGYLEDVKAANISWMESMNMPEEALEQQIAKIESTSPASQAGGGFIGTVVTSLVVGAITAIFVRKK